MIEMDKVLRHYLTSRQAWWPKLVTGSHMVERKRANSCILSSDLHVYGYMDGDTHIHTCIHTCVKVSMWPAWWHASVIPAFRSLMQGDLEFQSSLVTQQDPVSNKKQSKQLMHRYKNLIHVRIQKLGLMAQAYNTSCAEAQAELSSSRPACAT